MNDLSKCPVCGAKLVEHEPENDNEFEYWTFDCYLVLCRDGGKYFADVNCEGATEQAIQKLNAECAQSIG